MHLEAFSTQTLCGLLVHCRILVCLVVGFCLETVVEGGLCLELSPILCASGNNSTSLSLLMLATSLCSVAPLLSLSKRTTGSGSVSECRIEAGGLETGTHWETSGGDGKALSWLPLFSLDSKG